MKSKFILAASFVFLAAVEMASADVTVRITGSSAFRAATVNAIKNSMTFVEAGQGYAYKGTDFNAAAFHYFKGRMPGAPGAGVVTIKTNWSGSVQGILDVTAGNTISFIADTPLTLSPTGTPSVSETASEGVADITTADNLQGSTVYLSPSLTSLKIGIVPFAIVAGKDTLPGVTNITNQLFKALFTGGRLPSSLFTNNPADTRYIYAAGRDPFSGTRLTVLAETGYGAQNIVKQYQATLTAGTNTVASIAPFAATATVPDAGNNGVSGGTLASYLRYSTGSVTDTQRATTLPMSFIGYLGETDSYAAVFGLGSSLTGADQGNARYLSFNGVSAFGGIAKKPATVTVTSSSAVLTGLPAGTTTGLIVGQVVSGDNIPPGSTISSIDTVANTITIDKTPSASSTTTNALIGALLPAAIRNGAYTLWNYENLLYKSNVVTAANLKLPVANVIQARIRDFDYSFSGLADDAAMAVQRDDDGTYVYSK